MPTKKKRVGFIPRDDVMRIIDNLSIENNLSNSKIISILVEEALSIRGIFNKKIGKEISSYPMIKNHSQTLSDNSDELIYKSKLSNDTKLEQNFNHGKSNHFKEANQDAFDLQTYKKFLSFIKFQEMMDKYNS